METKIETKEEQLAWQRAMVERYLSKEHIEKVMKAMGPSPEYPKVCYSRAVKVVLRHLREEHPEKYEALGDTADLLTEIAYGIDDRLAVVKEE